VILARLVAFGADNGAHALSELDAVDLEPISLAAPGAGMITRSST
jgi:hypothetical protein